MPRPRLCGCGCGQPVTGRKSKRFCSDACPAKNHRRSHSDSAARASAEGANPLHEGGAVSDHVGDGSVTVTDREVRCSGCGSPISRLVGPLPVASYCRGCVEGGRCPCHG